MRFRKRRSNDPPITATGARVTCGCVDGGKAGSCAWGIVIPFAAGRGGRQPVLVDLAGAVTGELGDKVGVAPRLHLKKLVDIIDWVDQNPEFDLRVHYQLTVSTTELTHVEGNARTTTSPDDVPLDLDPPARDAPFD